MNKSWKLLIIFILLGYSSSLVSQQTALYQDLGSELRTALDLFNKEKFGAAQSIFEKIIYDATNKDQSLVVEATYYDAICALELKHKNAEFKLKNFIDKYPTSSKIKRIYFQLGKYHFNGRKYRKSLNAFQKVDRSDLTKDELDEYYFKTGYNSLKLKDERNAKLSFARVSDSESVYVAPSKYYLAHLSYLEKDFETALPVFESLKEDRAYKKIVPYYIIQIYYYQKKYAEILKDGPEVYKLAQSKLRPELAKLLAGAYYQTNDFVSALTYFEDYERLSRKRIDRDLSYQMAFSYLKAERYKDALRYFQNVTSQRDSLSQNAYYHLGYCYLQINDKKFASNSFLSASKMDYDLAIKEEALFNYAKLSIELSRDPYNNAINSLEKYLIEYPNSSRTDEANNYLVQLYMSTKNYEAALKIMDRLKSKDPNFQQSYQKIYYYSAIQSFNDKRYEKSIELFKKTIENSTDKTVAAESNYWIGEAFYRLQNYWGADKYYKDFLSSSAARNTDYFELAKYNLAYIQFNKKEYDQAINYFKDFLVSQRNFDIRFINDANLRIGDSYYITKRFRESIASYEAAARTNQPSKDYAEYHIALALGALGDYGGKISTLSTMVTTNKGSSYYDDALYDLGTTYILRNDKDGALRYFNRLVAEKPRSRFSKKALLRSGLIYYNDDKYNAALKALKQVISDYPGTAESTEALSSLKNIYVDMNNVDEYFRFANSQGMANIRPSEQDSLSYTVAENQYMERDYDGAISAFRSYLNTFPNGTYALNANFYLAECQFNNKNFEDAIQGYNFVVSKPTNRFTEISLQKSARINYNLKNYAEALNRYDLLGDLAEDKNILLEAIEGKMRCNFLLKNYNNTIDAANGLLKNNNISSDQITEAHYLLAKSYFDANQPVRALQEFKITEQLSNTEMAAESKYLIASINYDDRKFEEAEKIIFELSNDYSYYDYWIAKGFILLADVYIAMDNIFQAKQTLQSIIENYEGQDLVGIAREKLKLINEKENNL